MRVKIVVVAVVFVIVCSSVVSLASSRGVNKGANKGKDPGTAIYASQAPAALSLIPSSAPLINWEAHTPKADGTILGVRAQNNGNNMETARMTFDFQSGNPIEKIFLPVPKEKRTMYTPVAGTGGNFTISVISVYDAIKIFLITGGKRHWWGYPRSFLWKSTIYINGNAFYLNERDYKLVIAHEEGHLKSKPHNKTFTERLLGDDHAWFGVMSPWGPVRYLTTFGDY